MEQKPSAWRELGKDMLLHTTREYLLYLAEFVGVALFLNFTRFGANNANTEYLVVAGNLISIFTKDRNPNSNIPDKLLNTLALIAALNTFASIK